MKGIINIQIEIDFDALKQGHDEAEQKLMDEFFCEEVLKENTRLLKEALFAQDSEDEGINHCIKMDFQQELIV